MCENLREIVSGTLLPQFVGKKVSVTGLITNVNPNGLTFDIRTADDLPIKVNLKKPYKDVLEGYIEVHGTSQGKTIICDDFVLFPLKEGNELDIAAHNTLCTFLQSVPDLWKTQH